ncbi:MAG: hypothetical protein CVU22_18180 [Betaproteobacteria bacterium HGW-Betaproteobacteria-16]|nr:MAG: hypothetical protein CVU22_18180 [Betaproteobacteria bacterium HGW-Betaproteobacteria-16]
MRVDSGTNYINASRRPKASPVDRSTMSSSIAPTATHADRTKAVDFTKMTRQDMRSWINAQNRSGEMSIDDGLTFLAMTMKIPIGGGPELPVEGDETRYDFRQKVHDGIQGAVSHNDQTSLKKQESAMQIIQRNQGQIISVDIRA